MSKALMKMSEVYQHQLPIEEKIHRLQYILITMEEEVKLTAKDHAEHFLLHKRGHDREFPCQKFHSITHEVKVDLPLN